jgi:hypothetical protein
MRSAVRLFPIVFLSQTVFRRGPPAIAPARDVCNQPRFMPVEVIVLAETVEERVIDRADLCPHTRVLRQPGQL